MREDLLHAESSVDWAKSQLPSFKKRLRAWLNKNVHTVSKEEPPNATHKVLVAIEKEPLPLTFQVEAGAYINAIRSSLDILACTLAERHCKSLIDEAYFPITHSPESFASAIATGNGFKWAKFIKALPPKERGIIESLKPYKGGNGFLYPLHLLDIIRKHQRLLTVEIQPHLIKVSGWKDAVKAFEPVSTGWIRSGNNETIIGHISRSAIEQPEIDLSMQICLDETMYLPHREVVATIYEFANSTKEIIAFFDD
jgi:hypothetical protein